MHTKMTSESAQREFKGEHCVQLKKSELHGSLSVFDRVQKLSCDNHYATKLYLVLQKCEIKISPP